MENTSPNQLLDLAIAKVSSGNPASGLLFALRAIQCATKLSDAPSRRRALNIASHCCLMDADYVGAIDYGLQAAAAARALNREDLIANALLNVMVALTHIGQTEASIEIANRVAEQFSDQAHCKEDVRKHLTNAADAHLVDREFIQAIHYSSRAVAFDGVVHDDATAEARLIDEFNWMKAAIVVDQPQVVGERYALIQSISAAYPSVKHDLNAKFAKVLLRHYAEFDTELALTELEALTANATGFSTIYRDMLQWAIMFCESLGDIQGAARFHQALFTAYQKQLTARVLRVPGIASAMSTKPALPTIDPLDPYGTKRWVESLMNTPVPSSLRTANTEARLTASTQLDLERIALNTRITQDLTGHSIYRIGALTGALASAAGYSEAQAQAIELATRLHPIGAQTLGQALHSMPELGLATEIARKYGERFDGQNTADRTAKNSIPEPARLAAIAITYDELIHQGTLSHAEATEQIRFEAGHQFDPALVKLFLPTVERLRHQHDDALNGFLSANAPSRTDARDARSTLDDIVPDLTLLCDIA